MHLTDHEVALSGSVVALVAIVGGYLGVRSANRNALKLARYERTAQHKSELLALKRTTYAKCYAELFAYQNALKELDQVMQDPYGETREAARNACLEASKALQDVMAMIGMIATPEIHFSMNQVFEAITHEEDANKIRNKFRNLSTAMRFDIDEERKARLQEMTRERLKEYRRERRRERMQERRRRSARAANQAPGKSHEESTERTTG
jgi:hypothetical protein